MWLLAALAAFPARARDAASDLVPFVQAPYPFSNGIIPETGDTPFFSPGEHGQRVHVSPRGGALPEHPTYDDNRSLVVVPSRFDAARPGALVLFFHGNLATLTRDVVPRQRVVEQVERSGLNAVLVAPQLAVDALDSSPGRFYEPGFLDKYLDESARHLSERSDGRIAPETFDRLPVIIVAYSGGYLATAFCLANQSASRRRIIGVVLLDALFGEEQKFIDWIAGEHERTFFVSAYSASSAPLNQMLAADLEARHIEVMRNLPTALVSGEVVLLAAPGAVHNDFVTTAGVTTPGTRDPLRKILAHVQLDAAAP